MGTTVGAEGTEEAKVEDGVSVETGSELISPTHISDIDPDPVVYKLVRVDGDGRLVPATDDEVLVVEDLLKDEKAEHFASDSRQPIQCSKTERYALEKTQPSSEGNFQSENLEADAEKTQLENAADLGEANVQQLETVCELASTLDRDDINHSLSVGCSSSQGGFCENGSSNSHAATSSKPDFSRLNGEICLDNLSVKELHDTFRATFGRETSVKDKQWLKRRISMGLSNSCDFSTTTFIIKDNKVVKKVKEPHIKTGAVSKDFVVGVTNETVGGPVDSLDNQTKSHLIFGDKNTLSPVLGHDSVTEDPGSESRAAKRVRKPTKRYIEEISEVETSVSCEKLISSVKSSEHVQPCSQARIRPVQSVWSDGRPMVTRQDSLGGSGIKVPYVSRIRRSRPRENFMPLMKLQPNGIGMASRMVKKVVDEPETQPNDDRDRVVKARLSPGWVQQPLISASEETKHYLERNPMKLEKDIGLKRMELFEDNSDDNMVTVSTPSGGMRRKHHRPWSLTEVVKLVEGVAKYGAGRWSEIKQLAFASYSYRTSVDLKDKWRNLLRASFSQLQGEKGNTRKHASIPIPAPILMRVRELAQIQVQVPPPNLSSSKCGGYSGSSDRIVVEERPGFL